MSWLDLEPSVPGDRPLEPDWADPCDVGLDKELQIAGTADAQAGQLGGTLISPRKFYRAN